MTIQAIDKNFDASFEAPSDIVWFSVREAPFQTYGICYSEEEGLYRRLPKAVADAVSPGVAHLAKHTAGGRVRFATDSPFVMLRAVEPYEEPFSHMTVCGKYGFTLFSDNRFCGTYMPSYPQLWQAVTEEPHRIVFDGIRYPPFYQEGRLCQTELFFPLYSAVNEVYVGLKKGSVLAEPIPYSYPSPVLFYGSSITQGGCAGKPADDYVNRLCRMLDTDILNLGFSGSAKAEQTMVEYLSSLNPSVFVMDYDYNAPDAAHLSQTHFALYQAFRAAHSETPIVMMTMPAIAGYEEKPSLQDRRAVIDESYQKAKASGDRNVYRIDCYGCFGALQNGECGTVDDCHPDSLGFLRMAERVYPLLYALLNPHAPRKEENL